MNKLLLTLSLVICTCMAHAEDLNGVYKVKFAGGGAFDGWYIGRDVSIQLVEEGAANSVVVPLIIAPYEGGYSLALSDSNEYGAGGQTIYLKPSGAQAGTTYEPYAWTIEGSTESCTIKSQDNKYFNTTTGAIKLTSASAPWQLIPVGTEGVRSVGVDHNADLAPNSYDLQGRPYVRQPKRGLMIQQGRKVLR